MKLHINKKNVGSRIFNIRKKMNLTLEDWGKLFNASKGNALLWEQGSSLPNRSRLEKIAKIGNITINELLYGSIEEFIVENAENIIKNKYGEILFNLLTLNNIYMYCAYRDVSINDINSLENSIIEGFENYLEEVYNENQKRIFFLKKNYTEASQRFEMLVRNGLLDDIIINGKCGFDLPKIEKYENLFNFDNFLNSFNDKIFSYENGESLLSGLFYIVEDNSNGFKGYYQQVNFLNIPIDYLYHISNVYNINECDYDKLFPENDYASSIWEYSVPYKPNKYNLPNFDVILGLYIENENSTYFLANYKSIEDVPLNTEAQYFILNHDNTYQITKITEIPNCKYIAPIIGKLE